MVFSFTLAHREVLEQVVREPRFQALARLPVISTQEVALGLSAFGLFGLGSWLYLTGTIPFLLMLAMNSFAIYVSFTPLHDATHRSVSSNRLVNDLIGTVCCLLLLPGITTRVYRYLHLEHHRYAGDPERDPDEPFVSASPWVLPFVLAGLDVHWSIWYLRRFRTRPVAERVEFVAGLTFYVGIHAAFLSSPYALEFVLCFMIPQRFGLFYVAWFFAHIQHPDGMMWEREPFQTTVRVETNTLGHWLMLGQTFHCLHHLAPSIPFYRYRRAWNLGAHLFERQSVPTRTLWREAPDLVMPERLGQGWMTAEVTRIDSVGKGIRAFELAPAKGELWPPFEAGAHIDVKLAPNLVRQYSLCASPADSERYRIAVKRNADSRGGSEHLHTQVEVGSLLEVGAPRNNFPLRLDCDRYLLVAGGIGITPLLAMAHRLFDGDRAFELHLFARAHEEIAFHQTLAELPFADSISIHIVSRGALTEQKLASVVKDYAPNQALYLCGPTEFMGQVIKQAANQSWPSEQIFSETFVPAKADNAANTAFEVVISSSGETLTVQEDEFLIDVLHEHGYAVMCSCTQGICGSCVTPVLEGVPEHRDAILSDQQRATHTVMTVCVSRARSQRLVLDL